MASLTIGSLRVVIGADTKPLEDARKKADKEFKAVEASMRQLRRVAVSVGAALASVFTVRAIADAGKQAVDTMAQMQRLSEALGVSVEKFSGLAHAASQTGVQLEQFTAATRTLHKTVQEAMGDPMSLGAEAFRVLGISVTDAEGRVRRIDELMMEVADRFAKFADGSNKTALAIKLFGDEGTRLIPLLNRGSAGLREMAEEARRLGFTVDEQSGKAAVRFQEQLERLNSSFQGIVNRVIQNVLPQMEELARVWEDLVNDSDRLNQSVQTGELVWKALAATLVIVAGAMLAVLEGARGLKNFFSEPFSGRWEEDIEKLRRDFQGLINVIDTVKQSLAVILGDGARAVDEVSGRLSGFAAPGLAGSGDSGKPDAPRLRSTSEMSKDMEKLREELDLVLDRLNGLPNVIGEAYTINVTSFQDAIAAIDRAVQQSVLTQEQATRMKLRLTEQEQNAYKQTAQVAAQAITTLFPKSKAAAIASAIINTAVAVTEALKLPPPLNFVQAGLVAAAGAAQVATIASTNISGGGSSSRAGLAGGGGSMSGSYYYRGGNQPQGPLDMGTVLTVKGISPAEWFNGEALRELAEKLVQHQKDGGTVVFAPQ